MSCYYHPDRDFVSVCSACGQPVCAECNYVTGTHPICRRCWDMRIPAGKKGISITPVEIQKPAEAEKTVTAPFTAHYEPPLHVEPPTPSTQPKQVEPINHVEVPLQEAPSIPPEPIIHKEQSREIPAPRNESSVGHIQTAPAELITHHELLLLAPPISHTESTTQVPGTAGEPKIKHVEPKISQFSAPAETAPRYQEPAAQAEQKPKLDIGTRARSVLGSLSKLRLNIGGKGKQQMGPHYIQVAQQTFQCHQCGSENHIGELFCQTCGAWFQYSCPSCGAVVDPGFDSCPSCLTELGWGHMAEEEYHGYP